MLYLLLLLEGYIPERDSVALADALRIRPGDIVCFVGAGGKTTAMMKLASELVGRDYHVLVTTTTKILEPEPAPDERLVLAPSLEEALQEVPAQFEEAPVVILAQKRLSKAEGDVAALGKDYPIAVRPYKLEGIPPEWVEPLARHSGADVVLVEADGAAHRMLKAPNVHEPVIPPCATLVVPMADAEVLGRPLTDEYVHRPALLADLAGVPLGQAVAPEVLAVAIAHPQGGLKGVPAGARVVPLLTTHSPNARFVALNHAIRLILLSPHVHHVVVAHLRSNPIRWEIYTR
jgi:probable selenium-dependent hydroxylase accessory protein YqeC